MSDPRGWRTYTLTMRCCKARKKSPSQGRAFRPNGMLRAYLFLSLSLLKIDVPVDCPQANFVFAAVDGSLAVNVLARGAMVVFP
jgi:hypothetical protein